MSKNDNESSVVPIYAAVSPRGNIIKSSIGTFRIHARRFAAQHKNFRVVKLAELNTQVSALKADIKPVEITPQKIDTPIEVKQADLDMPRRKYTRKSKVGAAE